MDDALPPAQQPAPLHLPVEGYRDRILDAVHAHPVTIVTAETGAGKSTQVPQYLLESGYGVIVTQPRRLAARVLAEWVASQRGGEVGGVVGYRTAREKVDSPETRLLFCTDGLQLVRELTGAGIPNHETVLVLDEVHEWNTNMETLVAWVRKRLLAGDRLKVVCMSATLEADRLAKYFDVQGAGVPIVEVPGALFPVEVRQAGPRELISETKKLIKDGRNVLIFQPGKRLIDDTIFALRESHVRAVLLPLHGDLEPAEQEKVFKRYDRPKVVVSTNIAQTSVTIDDIDAVLDTGLEKRVELVDGIEGLYSRNISQADCQQRKGRAGRTKPGVYILCADTPLQDRPPYPIPEIQRVRLDQVVLRLALTGVDATDLAFYHQPDASTLVDARRALVALGAMTAKGEVTEIGHVIARLPLNVRYGRMVVEAMRLGCVPELLTIAACIEVGGLRERGQLWRQLTQEQHSDFLAELDVYEAAADIDPEELFDSGIRVKNYQRAVEVRAHLVESLEGTGFADAAEGEVRNTDRASILRSVMMGLVDHVYRHDGGYAYRRGDEERNVAPGTVLERFPRWIVGIPRDIGHEDVIEGNTAASTKRILTMCSEVDLDWMMEAAPHLVTRETRVRWSPQRQVVLRERIVAFNGTELQRDALAGESLKPNEQAQVRRVFADALAHGQVGHPVLQEVKLVNARVRRELEKLWVRSGGTTPRVTLADEAALYEQALASHLILGRKELEAALQKGLTPAQLQFDLDAIVPTAERARIEAANPEEIELAGKRHSVIFRHEHEVFFIRVELPGAEIERLVAAGVVTAEHAGRPVSFALRHADYEDLHDRSLPDLVVKLEARRADLAWREFVETHPPLRVRLPRGKDLPSPGESVKYDPITGARAYPSHSFQLATRQFFLEWFRTAEEAAAATKAAIHGRDWMRLDADYQAARMRAANVETELHKQKSRGRPVSDERWGKLRAAVALLQDSDRSRAKVLEAMQLMNESRKP